jgi:Zn-dependent protease
LNIDFSQVFILFSVLIASLTFHEAAHAWSADRLGDRTARTLGRVSLNPAVHVDPIGTIAFPLIAMLTNLPLIGWAKPVPVNTVNLQHHWKQKFMLIAAAGPASNLLLAGIAAIGVRVMGFETGLDGAAGTVFRVLNVTVVLNVLLAVFNMIPVPPLDGSNVVAALLPRQLAYQWDQIRPYGIFILYGLMFTGILGRLIGPPSSFLFGLLL